MSLKRDLAANFISQGWLVLMSFAFVPLYIEYLGVEAYGLVGLFVSLQAWLVVIDLGLSMTLNREMARSSMSERGLHEARRLLGSAQLAYCVVGGVLVAGLWSAAPYLADYWFRSSTIARQDLLVSLRLLGLALVLRWASQIYRAAIQGLQEQVWLGAFVVVSATVRTLGAVALLVWFGAGVTHFFAWQLCVSGAELAVVAIRLHSYLPRPDVRDGWSLAPLKRVWRFAAGVLATDVVAVIMTQSDKVILSRMLTLEEFGYYSFAFTIGTAIAVFKTPVFQAVLPRISSDLASGDARRLAETYHKASQTMAVLVLPAAAVALFHARGLIFAWSGDSILADRCAVLAAVFSAAYMLNALVHAPAALALGHGWSGWGMITNSVAAVLIVPAVILSTARFGPIGAAVSNLALNALYFLVAVRFLHQRVLRSEWPTWLAFDCLGPMLVAVAVSAALIPMFPEGADRVGTACFLVLAWLAISVAVGLSVPYPRSVVLGAALHLRNALAGASSGKP